MWVARDQAVLRYLLSSLTRETLMHVSCYTTATQTWTTLATPYSSQMRTCLVNTRIALATTKKNHLNVSDYYSKMCLYADDLEPVGTPLCDDELIAYLLASLDVEFNSVFTFVVGCVDPISPTDLYAQLLSFKQHTSLQGQPSHGGALSAMTASRGGPSYSGGRGSDSSSRGSGRGHGCGRSPHGGYPNQSGRGLAVLTTLPDLNVMCARRLVTPPRSADTGMRTTPVLSLVLLLLHPLVLPIPTGIQILVL
jgi:hypothetical protein